MKLFKNCPLCKSNKLIGFAIDCKRDGPHISRVKCCECDLIFANPMANKDELKHFYENYYNQDKYQGINFFQKAENNINRIKKINIETVLKEAPFLLKLKKNKNFLDVGCGLGNILAYADKLEFKLYATDYDQQALDFVSSKFKVECFNGDLSDAKYPDNFFDQVNLCHVIEHVINPLELLVEIKRILKPNGVLSLGTPNSGSILYKLYRYTMFFRLKVPEVIDGLEHTYVFSEKLLANVCRELGYNILLHYSVGLGESISNLKNSNLTFGKKINRLIQNFFKINQWIVCQK